MPLNAKGHEIMANMKKQYGEEEGERVFYASKNAGTISGVDEGEEEQMADHQEPGLTSQDGAPYKEIAPTGSVSVAEMWRAANEHRQPEQQLNTPERSQVGDTKPLKEGIARLFDR